MLFCWNSGWRAGLRFSSWSSWPKANWRGNTQNSKSPAFKQTRRRRSAPSILVLSPNLLYLAPATSLHWITNVLVLLYTHHHEFTNLFLHVLMCLYALIETTLYQEFSIAYTLREYIEPVLQIFKWPWLSVYSSTYLKWSIYVCTYYVMSAKNQGRNTWWAKMWEQLVMRTETGAWLPAGNFLAGSSDESYTAEWAKVCWGLSSIKGGAINTINTEKLVDKEMYMLTSLFFTETVSARTDLAKAAQICNVMRVTFSDVDGTSAIQMARSDLE